MRLRRMTAVVVATLLAVGVVTSSSPASAVASGTLSIFAGTGTNGVPVAGPATSSNYTGLVAEAIDSAGNVYFSDESDRIVKITPGGTQTIFAGTGTSGAPTPGPAAASRIGEVDNMNFDSHDNLYLADFGQNVIEKVTPSGMLSIFAGNGSSGAPVPGPVGSSPMYEPSAVAVDANDNVFVSLFDAARVVKITPAGTLSFFVGNGSSGAPIEGPALSTPMFGTFGLTVDANNNLYINAYDSFCQIDKVSPSGTLSRYVGNGTCASETAGLATAGSIGYVYGSASVDFQGNLYFVDSTNYTVGKVTPGGTLSTVAGIDGVRGAPTPGPAASSHIGGYYSVAVDRQGNFYVGDDSYYFVEKVTVATAPSAPTGVTAALVGGSITAGWTAPTYGNATTSYTVTPIINGIAGTPVTGLSALTYSIAAPSAATTYAFSVQALNATGGSPASATSNVVTTASAPTVSPPTTTVTPPTAVVNPPTTVVNPPQAGIKLPIYIAANGSAITVPSYNSADPASQVTAPTSNGLGSWTLGADGGVFNAGNAGFFGSHGGSPMNAPAVGIASTASGNGYLIAGADGGVFAYGDATFAGSMGGKALNASVQSIASTCSNGGYYLVASDGGVFAFGDANFHGSMAGKLLNQPMAGIADACGQHGYWTFAKDGGVFAFGNADFYGSLASNIPSGGVVGMVSAPDGKGYWLIGANGRAYAFGSANQ